MRGFSSFRLPIRAGAEAPAHGRPTRALAGRANRLGDPPLPALDVRRAVRPRGRTPRALRALPPGSKRRRPICRRRARIACRALQAPQRGASPNGRGRSLASPRAQDNYPRPARSIWVQPGLGARRGYTSASLLAATMPEIRRRTAFIPGRGRAQLGSTTRSRRAPGLLTSRAAPRAPYRAAAFEPGQRAARNAHRPRDDPGRPRARLRPRGADAAGTTGTRDYQAALTASLARLPDRSPAPARRAVYTRRFVTYSLPSRRPLLTGVGEISDGRRAFARLTFGPPPGG